MKGNGLFFVLLTFATFSFTACEKGTTSNPQTATIPPVNRLIFEADADSGGHLKMEIDDTHIESLLDGNTNIDVTPLLIPYPPISNLLSTHESLAKFTLTNINYYGETISEITCDSDPDYKFPLLWQGFIGDNLRDYYEGFNGYLYLDDISQAQTYALQGVNDTITYAAVADNTPFSADCTSTDGESYIITFYDATDVRSHGIQTTFSVETGSIKGIVRLHRVGDGHVPPLDMLF